eukprot:4359878-Prymnesium_polylepis.1
MWGVCSVAALASFAGMTSAFWIAGADRVEAAKQLCCTAASTAAGWLHDSGDDLLVTGYLLCTFTCVLCVGMPPLYRYCYEGLQLIKLAEVMLLKAPRALLPPIGGAIAQGLFLYLWLGSAAYLASSGKLQVNEYAFGSGIVSSALREWTWLYVVGGAWTSM